MMNKDHGDPVKASHFMEEARNMDLADRYLNNKAARYFLRYSLVIATSTLMDYQCR